MSKTISLDMFNDILRKYNISAGAAYIINTKACTITDELAHSLRVVGEFAGNIPITIIDGNKSMYFKQDENGNLVTTNLDDDTAANNTDKYEDVNKLKKLRLDSVTFLSNIEGQIKNNNKIIHTCESKNEVLNEIRIDIESFVHNLDKMLADSKNQS